MSDNAFLKPPQDMIDEYESLADKYEEELGRRSQLVAEIENFFDQINSAKKELENIKKSHNQQ